MNLECLTTSFVALLALLNYVRLACHCQKCGQPIVMLHYFVRLRACWDLPRPTHQERNPKSSLPVGVLLAAKWGHCPIGPGIHMWPVVRAIHDERISCDSQFVKMVEYVTNVFV